MFSQYRDKDDQDGLDKYLLKLKSEGRIDECNKYKLNQELAEAVRNGRRGCVDILLKHGADPNYMEQFQTMLQISVFDKRGAVFLTLWKYGARATYDPHPHRVLNFRKTLGGNEQLLSWLVSVDNVFLHSPSTYAQTFVTRSDKENVEDPAQTQGINKMEIWTQILQNDDVELLRNYCENHPNWLSSSTGNQPLETAQKLSEDDLHEIFQHCKFNGHGIWTFIEYKFSNEIRVANFESIARTLSGLQGLNSEARELCDPVNSSDDGIFTSITHSLTLLALLTGRFNVLEELLRRRQFDILPATMLVLLIIQHLMKKRGGSIIQEGGDRLQDLQETLKNMLEDAVKRMSHLDNDGVMRALQLPLKFYGNMSLLELADRSECDKLLSLSCCQTIVADQWRAHTTLSTSSDDDSLMYRKPTSISSLPREIGSPRFKFWCHSCLHVIFLICFSTVLVREFGFSPTVLEISCFIFVIGYGVEIARTTILLLCERGLKFFLIQERYWFDFAALIVILAGFICRLTFIPRGSAIRDLLEEAHSPAFFKCRVLLLVGLLLFYIRLLPILSIQSVLGPRLTMMRNMLLNDLLPLLSVFVVLLLSFGVVIQSLLYPNGQTRNNTSALPHSQWHYVFQRSFYGMFAAEYPLEELKCKPEENGPCPNETGSRLVLYAFHATFVFAVNVTLINLLIALFSNTVNNIAARARSQWLAARFQLVETYKRHSLLPPPLNIFSCIYDLIKWYIARGNNNLNKSGIPLTSKCNADETEHEKTLLHFLIIQAFALRGQRSELGSVRQRWESEISTLKQDLQTFINRDKMSSTSGDQ